MKNLIITGVTTVSAKVKDGETAYRLTLQDENGGTYAAYFISRGIYEDGIIKSFKRIQAIPLSKVNT